MAFHRGLVSAVVTLLALSPVALSVPAAGARAQHNRPRVGAGCPYADTLATAASQPAMRSAVVCLLNAQRTTRGLPRLTARARLNLSAQHWTRTMVASAVFGHGNNLAGRISATGYVSSAIGENIATGFQTPRSVVRAWMGSLDHCRNILDPDYADVGTGVSTHRFGRFGFATWTLDFGLRSGHRAPSRNTGPQSRCPY